MVEQADKPPYVRFQLKEVEDRDATIRAGHYVTKDIEYALITPRGSRDLVERPLDEYFKNLQEMIRLGRYKTEWLVDLRESYKAWKAGLEIPEKGTSLRNWPMLSPSQLTLMLSLNIRTVEDVAEANEETVTRMGMGGRALKTKAQAWLQAGAEPGKLAERLAQLDAALLAANGRCEALQKQNEEIKHLLAATTKTA